MTMTHSGSEPGFPRLRPVEASPVTIEGQPHYALHDPSNVCEQTLYVTDFTVTVLSLFDGAHDIPGMYREIQERFGAPVPPGAIENLARQLDEAYLLDTPRFRAHLNALRRDYAALPEREPAFAGRAYEADPAALQRQLDAFYEKLQSPDIPANAPPLGIVAPHIDISAGGPVFAAAFDAIRRHPADLYIILGTAHALSSRTFCLAPKDFATPLGAMPLHQDAAQELIAQFGPALRDDEFTHRGEHSIEFQCVFLRHALGPDHPARILPLYVSSMYELLGRGVPFHEDPEVQSLAAALRAMASRQRTTFIAGVDFAHVGLRFGDPEAPDQAMQDLVRRRDLELADILAQRDQGAFFAHFREDMDARHVCGMSALALFLSCVDADRAALAGYDQIVDGTGSLVSYAGMVFC
jgi:AmmeMemoRadiSam system protein B